MIQTQGAKGTMLEYLFSTMYMEKGEREGERKKLSKYKERNSEREQKRGMGGERKG